MEDIDRYLFPTTTVIFGSLNGRPPQIAKVPLDTSAAKVRYVHVYRPRGRGRHQATYPMSQIGIVDAVYSAVPLEVEGMMPKIPVPRRVARLVKKYDLMVAPSGNQGLVFAKESELKTRQDLKRVRRLALDLYRQLLGMPTKP